MTILFNDLSAVRGLGADGPQCGSQSRRASGARPAAVSSPTAPVALLDDPLQAQDGSGAPLYELMIRGSEAAAGERPCLSASLGACSLTILQRGDGLRLCTEVTVPNVIGGLQAQLVGGEGPQPERDTKTSDRPEAVPGTLGTSPARSPGLPQEEGVLG